MYLEGFHNVDEERVGCRVAQSVGLRISGIAGQIIKAFQQGVISGIGAVDKLSELFRARRINLKSYEPILAALSKA